METITSFKGKHAFLSNFHPSEITEGSGLVFPTAEHAFQAAKTTDPDERAAIAAQPTPGKAKRAGRKVTLRPDWEQIKFSVMAQVVRMKFRDPELAALLEATGHATIIEGNNWHDNTWGECTCDRHRGEGKNALGMILMDVRAQNRA